LSGKPGFDMVWQRILSRSGEPFFTKTGLRFTYKVHENIVVPNRVRAKIKKNHFMKAFDMAPVKGPSELASIVQAPSYVWAIIHDARISLKQW